MGNTDNDETGLYSLLYCSEATPAMSDDDIPRIIGSAWRHNPKAGITGLLMYGGGMFAQWLEGPREQVHALMQRLALDPRHRNIVALRAFDGPASRLYPSWSMQLVSPLEILGVLDQARRQSTDTRHTDAINELMAHLCDGPLAVMLQG